MTVQSAEPGHGSVPPGSGRTNAPVRLAVAGVGNNISALVQGKHFYRTAVAAGVEEKELPGVRLPRLGGLGVFDVTFVAAFDVDPRKQGLPLHEAVLAGLNNYPNLGTDCVSETTIVRPGIDAGDVAGTAARVVDELRRSGAEVLLYSLPTGLAWAADAYARAALEAGVAFVNCTPESVARDSETLAGFVDQGLPVLGDDLASHLGTSVVHRSLLGLLAERGLTLDSSYQVNLGGNEDFRNLSVNGATKRESKVNALTQEGVPTERVEVIPSGGYLRQLGDQKVAYVNIEGRGWGGTPIAIELRLRVQDSSNAAGVIIDLVRIAATARRNGLRGFVPAAAPLLKSPPGGKGSYPPEVVNDSLAGLDRS